MLYIKSVELHMYIVHVANESTEVHNPRSYMMS